MSRSLMRTIAAVGVAASLLTAYAGTAEAAPLQIRFMDVDSASYGSFVGVYGAGFGDTEGSVQFGGATAIDVRLWSDTLIIARIPAGAVTGTVKVTPNGGAGLESKATLAIHTGNIYVVSTAGNDTGPGDEDNPFQSLHKAMSVAQAGDTVLIRAGTYDEQDADTNPLPAMYFRPGNAGTAAKPITWRGFAEEVPVIRGTRDLAKDDPILFVGADYVRLARLEINGENNTGSAVSVYGSSVSAVGLDVHSFGQTGITVGEVGDTTLAGNHIHDGGTRPDLDHGIHMMGQDGTIRNNVIEDLPNGYGIYLQYQTQATSFVFGNLVQDVAGGGIGLARVKGGNRIYNNIVWNAGASQGCMCAMQVAYGAAAGETSTGDRVYFNTFVGPTFAGAVIADRAGTVELHGNIFANFRIGVEVEDDVSKPSLSSSHNLWYGGAEPPQFKWAGPLLDYTTFKNQSQQESASLLANPDLVDMFGGDMHLSPGSPAIDVGGGPDQPTTDFDGEDRPLGNAIDLGALEYTGASGGGGSGGSGGGAGGEAGSAGAAGSSGSGGGTAGSGGSGGSGVTDGGTDGGTGGRKSSAGDDSGGCGCSTPGTPVSGGAGLFALLGVLVCSLRRRSQHDASA